MSSNDLQRAHELIVVESWVRVRASTEPSSHLIVGTTLDLSPRDRLVLEVLYSLPAIGVAYAEPR